MEYTKSTVGRIFVLKFADGDAVIHELSRIAKKEKIKTAAIIFIGALKKGDIVTGPKKPIIPPEPNWVKFKDAWEVIGMATIYTNKKGPQIHVHASMGQKNKALTGCVRKDSKVFLVLEAVMFELKGVKATKDIDPNTGLNLLRILRAR